MRQCIVSDSIREVNLGNMRQCNQNFWRYFSQCHDLLNEQVSIMHDGKVSGKLIIKSLVFVDDDPTQDNSATSESQYSIRVGGVDEQNKVRCFTAVIFNETFMKRRRFNFTKFLENKATEYDVSDESDPLHKSCKGSHVSRLWREDPLHESCKGSHVSRLWREDPLHESCKGSDHRYLCYTLATASESITASCSNVLSFIGWDTWINTDDLIRIRIKRAQTIITFCHMNPWKQHILYERQLIGVVRDLLGPIQSSEES